MNTTAYLLIIIAVWAHQPITNLYENIFVTGFMGLIWLISQATLYGMTANELELSYSSERITINTPVSENSDIQSIQQLQNEKDYCLVNLNKITSDEIVLLDVDEEETITVEYDNTLDNNELEFFKNLREENPESETFVLEITIDEPTSKKSVHIPEQNHTYTNYNSMYISETTL
jgi:hypothetical protein